jgi:hypothetical protein
MISAALGQARIRDFGREHPNAVYDSRGRPWTSLVRKPSKVLPGTPMRWCECKLAKGDTRLVADEVVITDYAIVEPLLLAGRLRAQQTSQPGATTRPIALGVWVGAMVVDG